MEKELAREMAKDVAKELLTRYIEMMERGIVLGAGEVTEESPEVMAQRICFDYRDEPKLSEEIARYTELADSLTDGTFSAVLEAARSTKQ